MSQVMDWFTDQQRKSTLEAKTIPLGESEWRVTSEGTIALPDNRMYVAEVRRYRYTPEGRWFDNLQIRSTSPDVTRGRQVHGVILLVEHDGRYLVQAKAEAGNTTPGHVVLTTTLQASHTNLKNNPVPYRELASLPPEFVYTTPQDPGMLHGKNLENRFVRVHEEPALVSDKFYLAKPEEIAEIREHDLVSSILLEMLGHVFLSKKDVSPQPLFQTTS